jgi:hypothetical protein
MKPKYLKTFYLFLKSSPIFGIPKRFTSIKITFDNYKKILKSLFLKINSHLFNLLGQILFLAIILLFLFLLSIYFSQIKFLKKHSNLFNLSSQNFNQRQSINSQFFLGNKSNIQITDLDFNTIKTNLKKFLQSQNTLQDYNYEGSALSTLLDILSYNTQYNAYYLNMVANEMFLDSALQRSSVVSHAKLLNYIPKSASAPSATIDITFNQVTDSSLTIPKFTSFMSEAIDGVNYKFVTVNSTTLNTNLTGSYIAPRFSPLIVIF